MSSLSGRRAKVDRRARTNMPMRLQSRISPVRPLRARAAKESPVRAKAPTQKVSKQKEPRPKRRAPRRKVHQAPAR
eukprot:5415460-Lingulodinium_polyedra.AAC.1